MTRSGCRPDRPGWWPVRSGLRARRLRARGPRCPPCRSCGREASRLRRQHARPTRGRYDRCWSRRLPRGCGFSRLPGRLIREPAEVGPHHRACRVAGCDLTTPHESNDLGLADSPAAGGQNHAGLPTRRTHRRGLVAHRLLRREHRVVLVGGTPSADRRHTAANRTLTHTVVRSSIETTPHCSLSASTIDSPAAGAQPAVLRGARLRTLIVKIPVWRSSTSSTT